MLNEAIKAIAVKHLAQKDAVGTEEATKTAFVMPFIAALGYDVFNPVEVVPEFIADVGTKKGEKVDYALMVDGKPEVLIECKPCNGDLNNGHSSQLFRYFGATDAHFAILTNGVEYRFFADLENRNRMDERPFFTFNVHDFDEMALNELTRFSKEKFDTEAIMDTASSLKNLNLLKTYLKGQFESPDDDFIRFVSKHVYDGKMTHSVFNVFEGLVKRAIDQVIKDRMRQRLNNVFDDDEPNQAEDKSEVGEQDKSGIVTTEDEILGHRIIQAIVAEIADPDRVVMRDAKSYCAILFDNNNTKPLVRLHFNTANKKISLFDPHKKEDVIKLESVSDLYQFRDRIQETAKSYMTT